MSEEIKKRKKPYLGKYLPLGTVVLMKGGKKRIMIIGFCPITSDGKKYDYFGVLYPEGLIDTQKIMVLEHNKIAKVCHMELCKDKENKEFLDKMKKFMKNKKKGDE